ncbi:MAG TPA: DUF2784 domain-containing protein [Longimicrobiales bacterium]|nr:DUF2784 domain-containing protein [Longimicrobiales bacterium]
MILSLLADLVLAFHAAFVGFVVLGGLLTLRWPRAAWVHVPCALWGSWVVIAGWICPLTPLEVSLRRGAGEVGYGGGFLEHYVQLALYPPGLTRPVQVVLGLAAVAFNVAVYAWAWRRRRRSG